MMEDFEIKYAPKTVDDIVFKGANEKLQIEDIVNGKVPFPNIKCGIVLYGKSGTGKSSLKRLSIPVNKYDYAYKRNFKN